MELKFGYKPYSKQIRECKNNGNLICVNIHKMDELICIKYQKICSSIVCKTERLLFNELQYN